MYSALRTMIGCADRNTLSQNAKTDLKPSRRPYLIARRHILNPAMLFNQPCQGIVKFASGHNDIAGIAARAWRIRSPSSGNAVH
jgi:hypothetical protein